MSDFVLQYNNRNVLMDTVVWRGKKEKKWFMIVVVVVKLGYPHQIHRSNCAAVQ